MMAWVLVIILTAGDPRGGVAIDYIDMASEEKCEVAKKKILAEVEVISAGLYAVCLNRKMGRDEIIQKLQEQQ